MTITSLKLMKTTTVRSAEMFSAVAGHLVAMPLEFIPVRVKHIVERFRDVKRGSLRGCS